MPTPDPDADPNPTQVLNDVWTEIAKLSRTKDYVLVAMQYLRFLLLEFRQGAPLSPYLTPSPYHAPPRSSPSPPGEDRR